MFETPSDLGLGCMDWKRQKPRYVHIAYLNFHIYFTLVIVYFNSKWTVGCPWLKFEDGKTGSDKSFVGLAELTCLSDPMSGRRKKISATLKQVHNHPDPDETANIEPAETPLDLDLDPPNVNEVRKAILTLKSGKEPGIDQIYSEMLKADLTTSTTVSLHKHLEQRIHT